ncbi:MAG: hypothetical protein EA377_01150 [Phycisphaerales bacterium]|nr:MAG: hypothetical protein EA377_01150 [Phycisphaerales bacterium]
MSLRSIKKTARQNRMKMDSSLPRTTTPAIISQIEATAADTIRLTFNARIFRNRVPGYTAGVNGSATVEDAIEISATVVELKFTGDVAGTDLIVEGGDQGVRTASGGFVPAGVYAIPTFP